MRVDKLRLAKLNKLTNWQASIIISVIGFATYFDGLKNQFLGDDKSQIVNNIPVHSITNIRLFFEGSTFYAGNGLKPLNGDYFRPLMSTIYSLLYTVFGPQPFYFHLLQLLLCIGSAIILYLLFRYSFKPLLALFLSLIFLVHPIDSQVVFYIAQLPDVLFLFFGILAIWLLARFKSVRSLLLVALCLFLTLLSKETGALFVLMSLLYLFWYSRKRLLPFIGIMIMPTVLYIVLRVHAIGLFSNPNEAPIDSLSLAGRLMTAPSIMLLYITKFIFPWKLASGYYWVHPHFSIVHFLIPLMIDLAVISLVIYLAFVVRKRASKALYYAYIYFAIWSAIGMLLVLQVAPLDMTACETWFYFSMTGVLGMTGVVIKTLAPSIRFDRRILIACMIALILILGIRTAVRGPNWSSLTTLAYNDITVSKDDYVSDLIVSLDQDDQGNFSAAKVYAQQSVDIYPNGESYSALGLDDFKLGDYTASEQAYSASITQRGYQKNQQLYENLAILKLSYANPDNAVQFIKYALTIFPRDAALWLDLATVEYQNGETSDAKTAIAKAYGYSQSSQISYVYSVIKNNQPLVVSKPQ